MSDFEWRLTWSGRKDSELLRTVFKYVQEQFPLAKDSKLHLVTCDEFKALAAEGKVDGSKSYWGVKEGELGAVSLSFYKTYSRTWDHISSAKTDFEAGWKAAKKS